MSLLRVRDLPSDAAASIARLCVTADERLPGQVEAVWVEGSLVLGDYRPGLSDIDLVVMTRKPLETRRRLRAPWPLSVTWTTRGALPTLHPITTATLHRHGIAARGPAPRTLVHDVSRAELAAPRRLADHRSARRVRFDRERLPPTGLTPADGEC